MMEQHEKDNESAQIVEARIAGARVGKGIGLVRKDPGSVATPAKPMVPRTAIHFART